MGTRTDRWARGLGILLGLGVSVGVVLAGRVSSGTGTLGADVIVAADPRGEIGVSPAGPFLSATGLRPGDEADAPAASFEVVNQTGVDLAVRLRGQPSSADLDGLLWVSIDVGDLLLFRGPLGTLRAWTDRAFALGSGEGETLTVRAWLPSSVDDGYEGRVEQIGLELDPTPVEATP